MEGPQPALCLVCSTKCAQPTRWLAQLQTRLAIRLSLEFSDRPPPEQEDALCGNCIHLLEDLDDLLAQVDRLRRQLRGLATAGRKKAAASAAVRTNGQTAARSGLSEAHLSVKEEPPVESNAAVAVTVAPCPDGLAPAEETAPVNIIPVQAVRVSDDCTAGAAVSPAGSSCHPDQPGKVKGPPTDPPGDPEKQREQAEGQGEEDVFLGSSSLTDDPALLVSHQPDGADEDDPLAVKVDGPDAETEPENNADIIGPSVPLGAKLIGTQLPAKSRARRRPPSKARAAARPAKPPVPWQRVEGPAPYQCTVCSRQFQYLASIKIHARTHTGERPHECDVCGRRFALRTTLINHRRLHTGDKPFKCDQCGREFAQQSYLIIHRRVHSKDKPYCCEVCGKTFKSPYYLNIHKRIHSGEKPYTCDDCGKGFTTVSNLYKHKRGHRGERQFCCEECGKTFRDGTHLRDHRRSHTGERPFACEVCAMTFAHAKTLNRHSRLHTGEKPYSCLECDKSFSRREALRDHAKVHETAPRAPSPTSAAAAAALADGHVSPGPAAADDRFYMVDVLPVPGVEEALSWPLEVYRTETGVTVYKTLAEDGAALYQTETGEVFREMAGEAEPPPPPPPAGSGGQPDERLFDEPAEPPPVLPAYDRLGI
ncbi:zinc finger protein 316-like [Amphibalanus amphitrite]|uniref:zinc finger protein 316-like n=1 Tax=Amphibalanus amphitrite TaxID=1232801 RepID=UPI001C91639B|nr:zinc finger protein 316-like [Amphibalanus amphitrite]XP_043237149.1 zinc finger protein 316-like [Amphibalanus amphitrite]